MQVIRQIISFIYSAIVALAIMPSIIYHLIRKQNYAHNLKQRFAIFPQAKAPVDIIFHAASVGELLSIAPIIATFIAKKYKIVVTTATVTGQKIAQQKFQDKITILYLPYDLKFLQQRFIQKLQPKMLVIVETELWPNLISTFYKNNIKISLVNARISDRSYSRYLALKFIFQDLLQKITYIAAQSVQDQKRLREIGANKVEYLGNIKYFCQPPADFAQAAAKLQVLIGNKEVICFCSTHLGEEELALRLLRKLQKQHQDLLLCIVPRHPERFMEVYNLSLQNNFKTAFKSKLHIAQDIEVLVGDTMGEIFCYLALANIVVMGGTFSKVGGHNILEPAVIKKAIIVGPSISNIYELVNTFKKQNAIVQVENTQQLLTQVNVLLQTPQKRTHYGVGAANIVANNASVCEALFTKLAALLATK